MAKSKKKSVLEREVVLTPDEIVQLRPHVFQIQETPEDLHAWVHTLLGIDLPNCTVDPDSNSNPLHALWTLYDAMARPELYPELSRVMMYASRDSFKTLNAAILEVLTLCHLERDVGHMAAIESQAENSQQYVKAALGRPILRDFVEAANSRKIKFIRYEHIETGESITRKTFDSLLPSEKNMYVERTNKIDIVICSLEGCNGLHVPLFVVDEIDVIPDHQKVGYEESKYIPTMSRKGEEPLTLLTSTRKFSYGLVQKELDNAFESGLVDLHWNIIDVTEACPPERHLPEEPKIDIYRSDELLRAISVSEWQQLPKKKQELYVKDTGYAGCLKNCKLFFACKGNLATKQKSTSPVLKSLRYVTDKFAQAEPSTAKAQLLCRKPSESGLIYPYFERNIHMLTAHDIAERISGQRPSSKDFGKLELIQLFKSVGADFYAGLDHGYTHPFAVVSFAVLGHIAYVFDVILQSGLELDPKIELCQQTLKWDPVIFPDTAYPSDNATFKRRGLRIRDWQKAPDSVTGGISVVRTKLWPAIPPPTLFFLKEDAGCEHLAKSFSKYHWALDKAGRITNKPVKEDDDDMDALRYGIMNVFNNKGQVIVAGDVMEDNATLATKQRAFVDPNDPAEVERRRQKMLSDFMRQQIEEATGTTITTTQEGPVSPTDMRKGGILWDI